MKKTELRARVAYFSMEVGLESGMSTYSGGLGILAGDTLKAAADLEIPVVGMTLVHNKGYFHQKLSESGKQTEFPVAWSKNDFLTPTGKEIVLTLEGEPVKVRSWKFEILGSTGYRAPVYFLDTDVEGNSDFQKSLTDFLYGGDEHYRLCQEVILGMGGVKMLRALGYENIECFHMNEGHAALLCLELVNEKIEKEKKECTDELIDEIREHCVFTTHTPVAAGHDAFPLDMAEVVLGKTVMEYLNVCELTDELNLTRLALRFSKYSNGVAMKHGEVSRQMFPGYDIQAITNGIHLNTWVCESFGELFNKYFPNWKQDSMYLRYAINLPKDEVWQAHADAKSKLIDFINRTTNAGFDRNVITIGFARRATEYKRALLLFSDLNRLGEIVDRQGKIQVVYAGKAHPNDKVGKKLIEQIHNAKEVLKGKVAITFVPNYDMLTGLLICPGVDVWLNNPRPPMEASGTSGMKAAANGVPSLSVLDGWWIEGCIENVTGWAVGDLADGDRGYSDEELDVKHARSLYDKLEAIVLPCYYERKDEFTSIMRHCISINGSHFNTQRMVAQYNRNAYLVAVTK